MQPGTASAPPLDARTRGLRAAGLAALWAAAALPVLLGWQRCGFARVFHAPCPGCGMRRAAWLLLAGHWRASLHLQPLAVPVSLAGALFAVATVWTTFRFGWPMVHRSRLGRAAVAAMVVAYVAAIALWVLRWRGYFGGPVPV